MSNKDDKNHNQVNGNHEKKNKTDSIVTIVVFIMIMGLFASFAVITLKEEEKSKTTIQTRKEEPPTNPTSKIEIKTKPKSDSSQPSKRIVIPPPQGFRPQPQQGSIPQPPQGGIPLPSKIFYSEFSNGKKTSIIQESKSTIVRKPQKTTSDKPVANSNQSSLFQKDKSLSGLYRLNELQLRTELDDYLNGITNYNCTDREIQKEFISIFVQRKNVVLLDKLLTKCSEKNILIKDKDYYNDVYQALKDDNIESYLIFEKHGIDFLKAYEDGNIDRKLIHLAAAKGLTNTVKQALDFGFPIDQRTELNETPLYLAIHNNHYETVEFLISKGALSPKRLEEYNNYGNILYYPVINKNLKMLDLLVKNGILLDDNLRVYTNDRKILKYIISKGKIEDDNEANEQDKEWEEAYKFIKEGNLNELIRIENSGKDLSKMFYDGVPAICIAVEENKPKIVEYLVKKYDCKKLTDSINGRNALHYAAMNTKDIYEEILDILLKNGFDPNEPDKDRNTPINFAVCCNIRIPTIAFTLLNKGANPNFLNNKNQNSLFFVIEDSYLNRFKQLLKKGADINQQDIEGNTPLHHYILKSPERDKGISIFLKGKANIKSVNNKKQTPLHLAIYSNDASSVCQLIMDKADLNQPDIDGNTALHYVAIYAPKNKFMMKHLTNNCYWDADFSIKNNEGKTPLDIEPNCFYQSEFKGRLPAKE